MNTATEQDTSIIAPADLSRFAHVPESMIAERRWVVWRYETPEGRDEPTKVPYNAGRHGSKAASTKPGTWSTFATALETYAAGGFDGIGFVLGDGWHGIDLDNSLVAPGVLEFKPWAAAYAARVHSYGEVSPSGSGVKSICRGVPSQKIGTRKPRKGGAPGEAVEAYVHARFFTVTGLHFPSLPRTVEECRGAVEAIIDELQAAPERDGANCPKPTPGKSAALPKITNLADREILDRALAARNSDKFRRLWNGDASDHANDDSAADQALCCHLAFWTGGDAVRIDGLFRQSGLMRDKWDERRGSDTYGSRTIDNALERVTSYYDGNGRTYDDASSQNGDLITSGATLSTEVDADAEPTRPKSVRELVASYPALRSPLIHGLLRDGETMNVIAPPKAGKSWLVYDLAIAIATGRTWLGTFQTVPAEVLILDNELHGETSAYRIPKVAAARGITLDEYADRICVENLRGKLRDVFSFGKFFASLEPGRFKVCIIDALYRAMPRDSDENDNGTMAEIFNVLDGYASAYGLSFILIHHSSKGLQSGKAVTDVGAGAGAQSRATDTHLVLRQHEEDDVAVIDAAVRSFAPLSPVCVRWSFPLWTPEPTLDPTALREGGRRRRDELADAGPTWNVETFVARFITPEGKTKDEILVEADAAGLSGKKAETLLGAAVAKGQAHKWTFGRAVKEKFATIPAPLLDAWKDSPKSRQHKGQR